MLMQKEKDLEKIASLTHEREYKKEEQIFKKLAPAEGMYVIVDGEVVINDPETKNIYADLKSGDFFGENTGCKHIVIDRP